MSDAYDDPHPTRPSGADDRTLPTGEATVELIQANSFELWAVTLLFFVVGDLVTTAVGLLRGGVAEVGPLVAPLIGEYGLVVMLPMKLLAVGACLCLWRVTPRPYAVGVPLGLAVFGVIVTGWNVGVIIASILTT